LKFLSLSCGLLDSLHLKDKKLLELMQNILNALSGKNLILKGGNALILFYGLDRFSRDLDFDCFYNINISSVLKILQRFGEPNLKKDTNLGKRVILHPYDINVPFKLDFSLRKYRFIVQPIKIVNSLYVYDINDLLLQKISAFRNRTVARDLYDIGFIVDKYYHKLLPEVKRALLNVLESEAKIYDLISIYLNVFDQTEGFGEEDLLKSVERLIVFYRKEIQGG